MKMSNYKRRLKNRSKSKKRSGSGTIKKGILSYIWIALAILVVLPGAVFFVFQSDEVNGWISDLTNGSVNGRMNEGTSNGTSEKQTGGNTEDKEDGAGNSDGKSGSVDFSDKRDTGDIRVYMSKKGKYKIMSVEDYLTGVLCAEVPSDFHEEALKAQAVVSRTYAYARNKGNYSKRASEAHKKSPICDDYAHCQAFITKAALVKSSGAFGKKKWRIMEKAVQGTRNMIITYEGKPANPLFHSCSGGMTESATNVWGGAGEPYLMPVKSPGEDEIYDGFETTVAIEAEAYTAAMDGLIEDEQEAEKADANGGTAEKSCSPITILSRTKSGRVDEVEYKGQKVTGVQVRTALNLRSTNFTIDMSKVASEKKVYVTTKGFGHGVGMSQYGAEAMARRGSGYAKILTHYYSGTKLEKIK